MQDLYSFFQFEPETSASLESLENKTKGVKNVSSLNLVNHHKPHQAVWEYRLFWPSTADSVSLHSSFFSLSSLNSFQSMILSDVYILVENKFLNLKIRHDKLAYKPLIEQEQGMLAYGQKIKFAFPLDWHEIYALFPRLEISTRFCPNLAQFLESLRDNSYQTQLITFQKKVHRCKLKSSLQLEISQFEINNQRWFSLCVEGDNYNLVKQETTDLKGSKGYIMGYVEFLEKYGRS